MVARPAQLAVSGVVRTRWGRRAAVVPAAPLEVRLDERVQLTVEDRLDVAGLVARALVLHELIRRKGVRADLTAERHVLLLPREGLHLLLPFQPLPFGQPGGEDLHRLGAVLNLRTLVL